MNALVEMLGFVRKEIDFDLTGRLNEYEPMRSYEVKIPVQMLPEVLDQLRRQIRIHHRMIFAMGHLQCADPYKAALPEFERVFRELEDVEHGICEGDYRRCHRGPQ